MDRVAALEIRHPVSFLVDMKADDPSGRTARRHHLPVFAYTLGVHRSRYVDALRAGAKP